MGEETSIWKKEISFRRKPKAEAPPAAPVTQETWAAEPESTSVWKKEISFRRKSKSDQFAVADALPPVTPQPVPALDPTGASEPVLPTVPPDVAPPVLPPMSPPEAVGQPSVPQTAPPVSLGDSSYTPEASVGAGFDPGSPSLPAPLPPVSDPDLQAAPVTPPAPQPVPVPAPAPVNVPERQPDPEPQLPPAAAVAEAAPATAGNGTGRLGRREKGHKTDKQTQVVGLKIGASQIAAAQVVNRGGPRIVRMARMPLQRGVVVGGELREPEELATALKAFFKKNKLPRTNVRLGISNNRIGVRTFEITGIDDPQQLANAVRFRAQETLPIPLDEAVLDHRILDEWVGTDGVRACRVLLVVAHRELVERYVGACRKAGLKLVGIDLEAFALLRALSDPDQPPGEDAAVVCVSIGHDRSTLAVSDGRVCEFTRVLAWGGSALDGALARVLDLTPSAVVPIKHLLSLGDEGEAAGLDARHADEARRAMVAELQTFARELVASLRFYQEQPKSLGIVEIVITGGAATCGGLAAELERLIGIPVRVADPLQRVRAKKGQPHATDLSTASMAVAVGLGIED
jgi:type IV pilus assembly protein PilM